MALLIDRMAIKFEPGKAGFQFMPGSLILGNHEMLDLAVWALIRKHQEASQTAKVKYNH